MADFIPETFRTNRFLDFAGERELTAQIGHGVPYWPRILVKELVDNAIDASEQAGIPPVLDIEVTRQAITVADQGPGLSGDTIAGVLDFEVRVSSREAYVGPSRGAQGNALKTLAMMPFALSGEDGAITIDSLGTKRTIRVGVDPIGQKPRIIVTQSSGVVRIGTSVQIALAASASWMPRLGSPDSYNAHQDMVSLLHRYALFNPHLALTARIGSSHELAFRPTSPDWKRWKPSSPPVPAWYDIERFRRLFGACLNADRERGKARFVREWISQFRGVSATARCKAILAATGLAGATLEALVTSGGKPDDGKLMMLLTEMQDVAGRPPKPESLGVIGEQPPGCCC